MFYIFGVSLLLINLSESKICFKSVVYRNDPNYANVTAGLGKNSINESYLNVSAETFFNLSKMMVKSKKK